MICDQCGKVCTLQEIHTYGNKCEDCWLRSQHLPTHREYSTGTKSMKNEKGEMERLDRYALNRE